MGGTAMMLRCLTLGFVLAAEMLCLAQQPARYLMNRRIGLCPPPIDQRRYAVCC